MVVVGSGAREHAIVHSLAQSPEVAYVSVFPGNPGMELNNKTPSAVIKCYPDINSLASLQQWLDDEAPSGQISPSLVVFGPEVPLAEGWVDRLQVSHPGLKYLGPVQSQARLEASKSYAKSVMTTYKIPTADFKVFYLTETTQAHQYLDKNYSDQKLPVLKADGLAAGKGVVLPQTLREAHTSLDGL